MTDDTDNVTCPLCGWGTPTRAAMIVHIKWQHVENNEVEKINKAVDSGELIEHENGIFDVPPS